MTGTRVGSVVVLLIVLVTGIVGQSEHATSLECPEPVPLLGWSTWNTFRLNVNESIVRESADFMAASPLFAAGYNYILLDDGWTTCQKMDVANGRCAIPGKRDSQDRIVADPVKFPSGLRALVDYVHSKRLKIGIYTAVSKTTCGGYVGSLGYEAIDSKFFADLGFDFVKHDTCNTDCGIHDYCLQNSTSKMAQGLRQSGRKIVYYIDSGNPTSGPRVFNPNQYHVSDQEALVKLATHVPELVWAGWGAHSGANMYKSWFDRGDSWRSLIDNAHHQAANSMPLFQRMVQPSGGSRCCVINFPDMLTLGQGNLSPSEERVEFFLWAMLGVPMILGADIRRLNTQEMGLVTNREILAVARDSDCIAGSIAHSYDATETWIRTLSDGTFAAVLVNKDPVHSLNATIYVNHDFNGGDFWPATFSGDTGLAMRIVDIYTGKQLGVYDDVYTVLLAPHDAQILRLTPVSTLPIAA